jgi:hypothetical protein
VASSAKSAIIDTHCYAMPAPGTLDYHPRRPIGNEHMQGIAAAFVAAQRDGFANVDYVGCHCSTN